MLVCFSVQRIVSEIVGKKTDLHHRSTSIHFEFTTENLWFPVKLNIRREQKFKKVLINTIAAEIQSHLINRLPPSSLRFKEEIKASDGQMRWSFPDVPGEKKEREVKYEAREKRSEERDPWRHSLLAGVLTAAAWGTSARIQQEKKVWEWASMGFLHCHLSLSLSLPPSLSLYSISLSLSRSPTLPSTPHLCGTLSAWARCRKSTSSRTWSILPFLNPQQIIFFFTFMR